MIESHFLDLVVRIQKEPNRSCFNSRGGLGGYHLWKRGGKRESSLERSVDGGIFSRCCYKDQEIAEPKLFRPEKRT